MKHTVHQMTKDTNGRTTNRCVAKFDNESDAEFFLQYKKRCALTDYRTTWEKREAD